MAVHEVAMASADQIVTDEMMPIEALAAIMTRTLPDAGMGPNDE